MLKSFLKLPVARFSTHKPVPRNPMPSVIHRVSSIAHFGLLRGVWSTARAWGDKDIRPAVSATSIANRAKKLPLRFPRSFSWKAFPAGINSKPTIHIPFMTVMNKISPSTLNFSPSHQSPLPRTNQPLDSREQAADSFQSSKCYH